MLGFQHLAIVDHAIVDHVVHHVVVHHVVGGPLGPLWVDHYGWTRAQQLVIFLILLVVHVLPGVALHGAVCGCFTTM